VNTELFRVGNTNDRPGGVKGSILAVENASVGPVGSVRFRPKLDADLQPMLVPSMTMQRVLVVVRISGVSDNAVRLMLTSNATLMAVFTTVWWLKDGVVIQTLTAPSWDGAGTAIVASAATAVLLPPPPSSRDPPASSGVGSHSEN
jgi:hypothetical protein